MFLRLWRWHATSCGDATAADFEICAEAWRQIVCLEEIYAQAEERRMLLEALGGGPAAGGACPAPTEETAEPVSESDTEADAEPPTPKKDRPTDASEAARRSFATRKRKAAAALDELRAAGVPLADIAAAAKGLTISEVMDALDRKSLALPVWVKIEKAVAKLTAKTEDADG